MTKAPRTDTQTVKILRSEGQLGISSQADHEHRRGKKRIAVELRSDANAPSKRP